MLQQKESLTMDKHSSLVSKLASLKENSVVNTGPG